MRIVSSIFQFVGCSIFLGVLLVSPVNADQKCKRVSFWVTNDTSHLHITVYKVKYYDNEDAKWRTNNVRNAEITRGVGPRRIVETLEYVGNEQVGQVQFQWKPSSGGSKRWSDPQGTGVFQCQLGEEIFVTIN